MIQIIKNAIKLVKQTEASWFENTAGNLNFYDNGNTMSFGYDSCTKLQIEPRGTTTKKLVLKSLKEKLEKEIYYEKSRKI